VTAPAATAAAAAAAGRCSNPFYDATVIGLMVDSDNSFYQYFNDKYWH